MYLSLGLQLFLKRNVSGHATCMYVRSYMYIVFQQQKSHHFRCVLLSSLQPLQALHQHLCGVHSSSAVSDVHLWLVGLSHHLQVLLLLRRPKYGEHATSIVTTSLYSHSSFVLLSYCIARNRE